MKIIFKPKSFLGRLAIVLIVTMPIFFYIGISFVSFYKSIPAGRTIPSDIITRPGVALSMLAGFASGIMAFIVGLVAIIKKKDYSIFVFISTIMGFLMLLWCFAEFLIK